MNAQLVSNPDSQLIDVTPQCSQTTSTPLRTLYACAQLSPLHILGQPYLIDSYVSVALSIINSGSIAVVKSTVNKERLIQTC